MAKTFAGLEEILAEELKNIGAGNVRVINRGVSFTGDTELMYKANYLCHTALRILKPVAAFKADDDEQLYAEAMKIHWPDIFRIDQTFTVNGNVFHSKLTHSQYVALRTKDAIVDQFREVTGKRPWVGKTDADIYIDVHISHDMCTISLDSSGESLHKRGYRIAADKAPINEVLAAGMIKLTGWKGEKDFYDPMCGSGTIPMEAAMQVQHIPAGYYRKQFAFMNWADYDSELWEKVKNEADLAIEEADCSIFASDRSAKAIGIAKRNLRNAGLHKDIAVKVAYFDSLKPKDKKGILVFNPPYGKRMEERGEIVRLYKGIGDVLKNNFIGFEAWIITSNYEAAKFIGLRPSARIQLFNGPIETRFIKYEMYEGSKKGKYDDSPRKKTYGNRTGTGRDNFKNRRKNPERKFGKK
ncbi:MAG: class I SAM-dependent RNA methyltransferase [Chlorobi bacterium]|nr:class I SAM-dependent RNA methyltransferase [Chlorobiota bacterium]